MKIYFAGSIRGGRNDVEQYSKILELLQKYGTVLTEHVGSKDLTSNGEVQFSEEYIFNRDTNWIRESDLVVAEVSNPSLGVGYELAFAENLGKKVICLYRPSPDKKLSAMIRGNKYFKLIEYNEVSELTTIFQDGFFLI